MELCISTLSQKIVDANITKGVKTPRTKKELPHYLSFEEARKILTIPSGQDRNTLRDRVILELFYATGVRISELVNIQFKHLRLEEGIIHVIGKGNKERIVMIGGEAQRILRKYIVFLNDEKLDGPKNFLFPALRKNKKNNLGHIAIRTVFNIVKKYF